MVVALLSGVFLGVEILLFWVLDAGLGIVFNGRPAERVEIVGFLMGLLLVLILARAAAFWAERVTICRMKVLKGIGLVRKNQI